MFKHPFYSLHGVVASEHPLASLIGAKVLERGGSAVDAAVATSFALTVTLPHLGGIGGDYFALVRDPDGRVYFVDGSGPAPKRLTRELVLSKGYREMPEHWPLTINVPGLVDGLWMMWRKWGSIEWSHLVEYSIKIAQHGFPVSHSLARTLENLREKLVRDPGSRATYYSRGVLGPGDKFSLPGLAKALRLVSVDPRSFYEGEVGEAIVEYVAERGGVLDVDDLKSYHAMVGEPLSITYRGKRLYEMPPPTQGVTTLHMLMMLEKHELNEIKPRSSARYELLLEIARTAYCLRDLYITDPKYMVVSVDDLLNMGFIKENMSKCTEYPAVAGSGDTTFYAVADREGWIVAGIQSLFHPFGSWVTEPKYNITLNSRASSFSLDEKHVNRLEPGKKTMHTLSAVIIEDYERVLAIGLSGGHYRPLLHAQIIPNILDYGMNPQEAIEFPRIIWRIRDNVVEYEEGLELDGLKHYRLVKRPYPSRLGVAAVVEVRNSGVKAGYTDVRGDGMAIGII